MSLEIRRVEPDEWATFIRVADFASAGALASCHLGGHRFSELARAGMLEERTPGSLIRADQMFMAERAPSCSSEF